jgi:SWI/SNF-related matrix-associated actin-dependent regulator 1 of chromatin subfamily A
VSSSSGSFSMNGWLQTSMGSAFDPLSAPGGLISHAGPSNALTRRRSNEDQNFKHEDGPPRKKHNRGSSEDTFNAKGSPPSPEIRRSGHRRHIPAIGSDMLSLSSDESMQESSMIIAGPSKPRLTKDRPPSSPDTTQISEPPSDREYISFKISHPTESPARIQAAWKQASGDVKRAMGFLQDPSWFPSPAGQKVLSSRVTEIDEATRAQRVVEKEKGKKSMIYANRLVLEAKAPATPLPQKSTADLVTPTLRAQASPLTPGVKAPQLKRAKKLVINSDSDSAIDESEDDRDTIYERRTLDYLNTSDSDALQELTGKQNIVLVRVAWLIHVKVAPQIKLRLSSVYDLSHQATISGQS